MRRPILFVIGTAVAGIAFAQIGSSGLLSSYGKAINDAKTIKSDYTLQNVKSGGAQDYSVTLKKPNMFRIDTPTQLLVADGKDVTTYDKKEKTYFKQAESGSVVKGIFAGEEVNLWAGFFDPNAFSGVKSKELGNRVVKGGTLACVEAFTDSHKSCTYMLNPADNLARKEQIDLGKDKDETQKLTLILSTKSLDVNGSVADDAFTFVPPDGSRELSLAELTAGKWYYDLDEAKKVAAASGKKIFVDFFATWCGPCKMLEAECFGTDEFKAFSSKLVFCRIDVDAQANIASQYGITAMPTQDILSADGTVLNQTIGYGGPEMFFNFLRGATGG